MRKSLPWLTLFGVFLLVSCASKKDANEKNFSEALNSYLAKKGQICLGIPSPWPVDMNESERRSGMGRAAEMAALEKVGLVRSHETETQRSRATSAMDNKRWKKSLSGTSRPALATPKKRRSSTPTRSRI